MTIHMHSATSVHAELGQKTGPSAAEASKKKTKLALPKGQQTLNFPGVCIDLTFE